ncbi:DUF6916 family protein [Sulfurirhabdus autotrophica]|uniref:DUF6916 domain-containing protein n=1 Tax=Sulfurirhabdus autotrophica TaxID=1706046 RepID=A0A4R3YB74_9PROT|nr:hypothetical protein [Sulfurirhabdus autotrophica]TCV89022.1 hypothetical protein EDC63_10394 [Sulfurirhabdus autotrophica]
MNRRQFLSTGAAACTVGFAVSNVMASPLQMQNAEKYSKKWFQQALNGQFHLDDKGWQGVRMELVAVNDGPPSSKMEQFSVVFRTNSSKQVPSGLYHVKHASDGWFQVYLERGLMSENGLHYHATFNLLT